MDDEIGKGSAMCGIGRFCAYRMGCAHSEVHVYSSTVISGCGLTMEYLEANEHPQKHQPSLPAPNPPIPTPRINVNISQSPWNQDASEAPMHTWHCNHCLDLIEFWMSRRALTCTLPARKRVQKGLEPATPPPPPSFLGSICSRSGSCMSPSRMLRRRRQTALPAMDSGR